MVPKDALSARGPGDARGFDPGGPGTRNLPMENPPTKSAVDEEPAIPKISDETGREVKNGAIKDGNVLNKRIINSLNPSNLGKEATPPWVTPGGLVERPIAQK